MDRDEMNAQRLMRDLYRMIRSRHTLFREVLARNGVTLQQFHLLMHMKTSGRVRVTDLSEMMLVSKPTASRMLNTLCGKGLARKQADTRDRRSVHVRLTPRGERVVDEVHERQIEMLSRIMGKMDESEMEAFLASIGKIADGLCERAREGEAGGG